MSVERISNIIELRAELGMIWQDDEDKRLLINEIDRLRKIIEILVCHSLWLGTITRGKACEYLGIERHEWDDWLKEKKASEV
jgi:hypothetical protein